MKESLDRFLAYLATERNVSPHTVTAYRTDLEQFLLFVAADCPAPHSGDVGHLDIRRFLAHLHGKHQKSSIGRKQDQPKGDQPKGDQPKGDQPKGDSQKGTDLFYSQQAIQKINLSPFPHCQELAAFANFELLPLQKSGVIHDGPRRAVL